MRFLLNRSQMIFGHSFGQPNRNVWLVMTTVFILTTSAVTASVVTFDWPNPPGWTAGTPTTGQTATQSFTSVSPNDISVSIYNGGVNNQAGYPQINSTNETGGLSGVNELTV